MPYARFITSLLLLALAAAAAVAGIGGDALRGAFGMADGRGRPTAAPPSRVVSLSPSVTENAFALGFGDRLVGDTSGCDHPTAAVTLPKVGGPTPDFERVFALRPDLVIGDDRLSGAPLARARELGLPVWAARGGETVDGVFRDLESLAVALGDAGRGRALADSLRARCGRVRVAVADAPPEARPRVLVEYWPDPLWTAGRGTFLDEMIADAGGRNLAAPMLDGWGIAAWERVLAEDPDVIVVAHDHRAGCARRPGWASLRAVRTGRVVDIPAAILVRPTPRLVDGIERLAVALHPERIQRLKNSQIQSPR